MGALQELAQLAGIQISYRDMAGKRHNATPEALQEILAALGIAAHTAREVRASTLELRSCRTTRVMQPVTVAWEGEQPGMDLTLPQSANGSRLECVLYLESGEIRRVVQRFKDLPASNILEDGGSIFLRKRWVLPSVPLGYHRIEVEYHGRTHTSLIISAPSKSYSHPDAAKVWGVFLPMYALHSKRSWGAGNLTDYGVLGRWVAEQGGGMIGTLPLLATFLGTPRINPSPYSPVSRLFWNEFYVDLQAVPEFGQSKGAQAIFRSPRFRRRLESARRGRWVDYSAEMGLRRAALAEAAQFLLAHKSSRRKQFFDFVKARPLLRDYARFRAACDGNVSAWPQWEPRLRQGTLKPGDYSPADEHYHLYAQWIAQQQIDTLVAGCRRRDVRLYLDLPVGVHPDGFDVWRNQEIFASKASVGAPPDMFFTKGQNWGFPPLHPQRLRETGYAYVIDYLRFQMRHAGMLRIDHVMGLHRLFWMPRGVPMGQGAYVSYSAEELHAIICLESRRHQTVVVGENLGIVPAEVNEAMVRHGFSQTCVVQFEQRDDWKQALRVLPKKSVVAPNTHDTPTFAAHWRGDDIGHRKALGLLESREVRGELLLRKKRNLATAKFLKAQSLLESERPDSSAALKAILAWLGASEAEAVLVSLEDLWGEKEAQNVPGTTSEYPNWKRKSALSLEEIRKNSRVRQVLAMLRRARGRGASG